jgi:hypothetical protein
MAGQINDNVICHASQSFDHGFGPIGFDLLKLVHLLWPKQHSKPKSGADQPRAQFSFGNALRIKFKQVAQVLDWSPVQL